MSHNCRAASRQILECEIECLASDALKSDDAPRTKLIEGGHARFRFEITRLPEVRLGAECDDP
jgi:hypothetical protein